MCNLLSSVKGDAEWLTNDTDQTLLPLLVVSNWCHNYAIAEAGDASGGHDFLFPGAPEPSSQNHNSGQKPEQGQAGGLSCSLCTSLLWDSPVLSSKVQHCAWTTGKASWSWLAGLFLFFLQSFGWNPGLNCSFQVGARIIDLIFVRDRTAKRELKLLNALLLVCPHFCTSLGVALTPHFW